MKMKLVDDVESGDSWPHNESTLRKGITSNVIIIFSAVNVWKIQHAFK